MITQKTVMSNLASIIRHGVKVRPGDRSMSWLPFYHDMGLVGLVLSAMASQLSSTTSKHAISGCARACG